MYEPTNKKPIQKCSKCPKEITEPTKLSIKLDGVFGYGIVSKDNTNIYSATGKQYYSLKHVETFLQLMYENTQLDFVLLFEIYEPDKPVNYISGKTRKKDQYAEALVLLHDLIPLEDFVKGVCDEPYERRYSALCRLWKAAEDGKFPKSIGMQNNQPLVNTIEEVEEWHKDWLDKGYEGVIGRPCSGGWVAGHRRNKNLWKLKKTLSYDLEVVSLVEGKGKYEGTLGKLKVRWRLFGNKAEDAISISVSGMTDTQRDDWWAHPKIIVGQVVKVDAMALTSKGMLREPRFKEVRTGDKDEPDL